MKEFPRRLHHNTPGWVKDDAVFHIRVRVHALQMTPLVMPGLAHDLLKAAQRYHELGRWWCDLVLLMPDHIHALLGFPSEPGMAETMRDWKRGIARFQSVKWQDNYFDYPGSGTRQSATRLGTTFGGIPSPRAFVWRKSSGPGGGAAHLKQATRVDFYASK